MQFLDNNQQSALVQYIDSHQQETTLPYAEEILKVEPKAVESANNGLFSSNASQATSKPKIPKNENAEADPSKRPSDSYVSMIAKALLQAENNELPISGIYKWIEDTHLFYKKAKDGWKNSVRHALSLHDGFVKFTKKSYSRGHFWTLNPMYKPRFEAGDYRKMKKHNMLKYHIQPQCNNNQMMAAANHLYSQGAINQQQPLGNITQSQNFNQMYPNQGQKSPVLISPTHAHPSQTFAYPNTGFPGAMYPNQMPGYQPNTISYYPNPAMYTNPAIMNHYMMQNHQGQQGQQGSHLLNYQNAIYSGGFPNNGSFPMNGSNNVANNNANNATGAFWGNQGFSY